MSAASEMRHDEIEARAARLVSSRAVCAKIGMRKSKTRSMHGWSNRRSIA